MFLPHGGLWAVSLPERGVGSSPLAHGPRPHCKIRRQFLPAFNISNAEYLDPLSRSHWNLISFTFKEYISLNVKIVPCSVAEPSSEPLGCVSCEVVTRDAHAPKTIPVHLTESLMEGLEASQNPCHAGSINLSQFSSLSIDRWIER